jgi:hypothetical protein
MSEDLSRAPEELEPEASRPGLAPAKKPLAEFLAEFEARLLSHPDEPATGAVQVVEDRAAGFRRAPMQVAPAPPSAPDVVPDPIAAPETTDVPVEDPPIAEPAGAVIPQTPEAQGSSAETLGEARKARGRRRRKHRHRAH